MVPSAKFALECFDVGSVFRFSEESIEVGGMLTVTDSFKDPAVPAYR